MSLAWIIPLFPLAGFLITGLFYRKFPVKWSGWFASTMVLISFLISIKIFVQLSGGALSETITITNWISTEYLTIPFEFCIDQLTSVMILIITGIGFLIHIYSIGYMQGDEEYNKFFAYMNLFIFFMLVLVLGGSYPVMFIGWEGVGLCSYLLIGFWNTNHENNNAARKAFVMNRIGDIGFLLAMFLIYFTYGSLSYNVVFSKAASAIAGTSITTAITMLLFAGATGKSAQIPLLTWLPDAMAGPTPVSALIHAATMVTAGVYMIARSNILYALSPFTMYVVAGTGLATSLLAAVIALYQNDIKKVLAYSTISQLGLMFLALGTGSFSGAIFHLMTHAFFKALLFLAAGSIIHALSGEQDIRNMGGLRKKLPFTFLIFLTGTLAISGIPPFSGFFSKDLILASAFSQNPLLWLTGLIVSIITAAYTFRIFQLSFMGNFRGNEKDSGKIHESSEIMLVPLVILAILATFGAIPFLAHGTEPVRFESFLAPVFRNSEDLTGNFSNLTSGTKTILMVLTTAAIAFTIFISYYLFTKGKLMPLSDKSHRRWLNNLIYNKFYIDEFYKTIVTEPTKRLSVFLQDIIDLRIFDAIIELAGKLVLYAGRKIRLIQTGNVGFYLFAMVLFIILVLFFNMFK
jgi:NADH-quinone oxidoreductase subunit L